MSTCIISMWNVCVLFHEITCAVISTCSTYFMFDFDCVIMLHRSSCFVSSLCLWLSVCVMQCDRCQPLYNAKPFRDSDPCRPCQCYGHATSCIYNETLDSDPSRHDLGGGGQCINCTDNTTGNQCDACVEGYFRRTGRSMSAEDVCEPCNCSTEGIADTLNNSNNCKKVCSTHTRVHDRCPTKTSLQ